MDKMKIELSEPNHPYRESEYFGTLLYNGYVTFPTDSYPFHETYRVTVYTNAYLIQLSSGGGELEVDVEVTKAKGRKGFAIKGFGSRNYKKGLQTVAKALKEELDRRNVETLK